MQIGRLKIGARQFEKIGNLTSISAENGKLSHIQGIWDGYEAGQQVLLIRSSSQKNVERGPPIHTSVQAYEKALIRQTISAKHLATTSRDLVLIGEDISILFYITNGGL